MNAAAQPLALTEHQVMTAKVAEADAQPHSAWARSEDCKRFRQVLAEHCFLTAWPDNPPQPAPLVKHAILANPVWSSRNRSQGPRDRTAEVLTSLSHALTLSMYIGKGDAWWGYQGHVACTPLFLTTRLDPTLAPFLSFTNLTSLCIASPPALFDQPTRVAMNTTIAIYAEHLDMLLGNPACRITDLVLHCRIITRQAGLPAIAPCPHLRLTKLEAADAPKLNGGSDQRLRAWIGHGPSLVWLHLGGDEHETKANAPDMMGLASLGDLVETHASTLEHLVVSFDVNEKKEGIKSLAVMQQEAIVRIDVARQLVRLETLAILVVNRLPTEALLALPNPDLLRILMIGVGPLNASRPLIDLLKSTHFGQLEQFALWSPSTRKASNSPPMDPIWTDAGNVSSKRSDNAPYYRSNHGWFPSSLGSPAKQLLLPFGRYMRQTRQVSCFFGQPAVQTWLSMKAAAEDRNQNPFVYPDDFRFV